MSLFQKFFVCLFQNLSKTKMFPVICRSILDHVSKSFIFECNNGDILTKDTINTVSKFMNTLVQMPKQRTRFNDSLLKLLVATDGSSNFEHMFTQFLTDIYEQFIKNNEHSAEALINKLTITYDLIDCILQYIQSNADKLKAMPSNSKMVQVPEIFYNILYWPLSLPLSRNEVSFFFDLFFFSQHIAIHHFMLLF